MIENEYDFKKACDFLSRRFFKIDDFSSKLRKKNQNRWFIEWPNAEIGNYFYANR